MRSVSVTTVCAIKKEEGTYTTGTLYNTMQYNVIFTVEKREKRRKKAFWLDIYVKHLTHFSISKHIKGSNHAIY